MNITRTFCKCRDRERTLEARITERETRAVAHIKNVKHLYFYYYSSFTTASRRFLMKIILHAGLIESTHKLCLLKSLSLTRCRYATSNQINFHINHLRCDANMKNKTRMCLLFVSYSMSFHGNLSNRATPDIHHSYTSHIFKMKTSVRYVE